VYFVIVAERILQAGSLTYLDGTTMKVSRQPAQPAPNDSLTKESSQLETRTIEVSGLPTDVSLDFLQLFFENEKNGGGTVDDISMQGKSALVTFLNSSGRYIVACTWLVLTHLEVLLLFFTTIIFSGVFCVCATLEIGYGRPVS
jgi:hypothetical protein